MISQNEGATPQPKIEAGVEAGRRPKNATRHFRKLNGRKPAFKRLMPATAPKGKSAPPAAPIDSTVASE